MSTVYSGAYKQRQKNTLVYRIKRELRRNWAIHVMWLPVLAYYIIFHYAPMAGLLTAFQDYKPFKGILGSKFVGFKWFIDFLTGPYAKRTILNTLILNILGLCIAFPLPILFALLLNEVKCAPYKKTIQTISYMPHFISLVVMCGMIKEFASSQGLISIIGQYFGLPDMNYLSSVTAYRPIYIASDVWKQMGWGSIIYLATLSAVDQTLYEAAAIDGANRFHQMWHITLPSLMPVIVVQLIMRIGHIMSVGSEKTILLYNEATYEVSDIVSSFVYRRGLLELNYSYGAAVGLFNSVINVIVLTFANWFARVVTNESLW